MNQDLQLFYGLVQRTRVGVLDWLETLPEAVFVQERSDFAYGSLRNVYAHIAECYLWWAGHVGFETAWEQDPTTPEDAPQDVAQLRVMFARVDTVVLNALEQWSDWDAPFEWVSPRGFKETLSKRWLLLHPITHEFHHKGQALALARVMGFPYSGKADTDLVSPF